jgi:HEAT repeat protein
MPKLLTGQLARWRDHSVQSPDPALTERFGEATPNACNVCHKDKSPAWAREHRDRWWKPTSPQLMSDVETVLRLRGDATSVPSADLLAITLDAKRRIFFRTTALFALGGRGGDDAAAAFRAALHDRSVDMRAGALELLAGRPNAAAAPDILPLIRDRESRIVRIEAAFALVRAGWRPSDGALRPVYEEAKGMLKGRRVFHDAYERLAFIADALGEQADVALYLERLAAIPQWHTDPWTDTALDLFQRRARHLMESGDLRGAAELFDRVATARGDSQPLLLIADLGELAHRSGDATASLRAFERLASRSRPGTLANAVAGAWVARLRGTPGAAAQAVLTTALTATEADITADEWRRRVDAATR